ncbi:CMP-N-acetylneuraminate-poly-alpha-2,8-sialyltransferase [Holothuria leucospilota]|uniref:CMP-N-acetylneuraminate-poly-alpha-2, 8-sialyltransferase n=1 Tax=Holothuria leucospilota TaxID=206669 RepID=A0A9Q1CSP6_HOLLE|nr:CMP-N-acetylneuraminate-poly-alpha-2,8-sialyltransferase [Holothuria leucospilota]
MTVVFYQRVNRSNLTFKQMKQYYVRNLTLFDMMLNALGWFSKQKTSIRKCYVTDIDPSLSTLGRFRRCAIVGNSGILVKSRCGNAIDSHDFVIRANMAPTHGYSDDVGYKTNLMLINDVMLKTIYSSFLARERKEHKVRLLHQLRDLNDTILWYPKDATKYNKELRYISHNFRRKKISLNVGFSLKDIYRDIKWKYNLWRYPSSGLYMLALAESLCDNVTLFGFYPYETDDSGEKVLRHYYEPDLIQFTTWVHNFDAEYKMLQTRRDKGLLEMITNPCLPKDNLAKN